MVENHCRKMPDDPLRGQTMKLLGIIDKPPLLGHTMLRVLIIGNAPTENLSQWSHLIKDSDIIIACDGALKPAETVTLALILSLATWTALVTKPRICQICGCENSQINRPEQQRFE